ncbi:hypothetical protein D9758_004690 [Tetrapyrgos nigripes]|uniref:Uncharacterized protein n=1 Tax=Tetrapyrgos nigripes TaxID=182062 RepID=A0A8H5LYL7_9AGAR|nr:hypothetical protein D9758_004690 [Tetrapyrgos nigripes]
MIMTLTGLKRSPSPSGIEEIAKRLKTPAKVPSLALIPSSQSPSPLRPPKSTLMTTPNPAGKPNEESDSETESDASPMRLPVMRMKITQEYDKAQIQQSLDRDREWWNEPGLIKGTYAFPSVHTRKAPVEYEKELQESWMRVEILEQNIKTSSLSLQHAEEKLEAAEEKIAKLHTEKADLQSELSCMRERLGQVVGELVQISHGNTYGTRNF